MPGVYVEYIKAGKFVVPVELTFQTETIKAPGDIRGLVNTSKWIERHNWKEIKAMLKPAVEACLKYNETPLDNIPKSHNISYGREVSLGYLIVPNKISSPLLSVLDTKKNCWTDDEDDEDELLGIQDTVRMEDHGSEFTEFIPTKTAIRVCVVRKSVVSIDDARRIRKELGVRSEDVPHYFSSATTHLTNDPGTSSSVNNLENFDKEKRVSEWAASAMYSHLHDSGNIGSTTQPIQSTSANFFNSDQQVDRDIEPTKGASPTRNDPGSDSEVENIPRTFGDPDEIRDAARIYPHVLNRDVDSGEDPDDDLSLPDIEPNPPKRKKGSRTRKKSASLSPSKSKRLTHNNILAISQEGQAAFSEEDTTYNKRGTKRSKRKRTVAVVEPMRTLPNGQVSFEHAIGALGSDKRRKARPGSSHGTDKTHSGGSRSKQPPAIDIVAPDDDRLTIKNPPEPLTVASSSASHFSSPFKEAERRLESEKKKMKKKKKKRRAVNIDDDPHKYERLTPSPLFSDEDAHSSEEHGGTSHTESDLEMPVLTKMVESGDEENPVENSEENTRNPVVSQSSEAVSAIQKDTKSNESQEDKSEPEEEITPVLSKEPNEQASPDITQIKANASLRKTLAEKKSFKRKLKMPSNDKEINRKSESESSSSKSYPHLSEPLVGTPPSKNTAIPSASTSHIILRSEAKSIGTDEALKQSKEAAKSADESEPETNLTPETTSPVQTKPPIASPSVPEQRKTEMLSVLDKLNAPREPQKVKRKKRLKNVKKKSVVEEKVKVKPKMTEMATQTDELHVVAQIEKGFNSPLVNNAIVKVSRSCDVSSEDEFYEMASQRSRRSFLESPIANSEASQPAIPTIYHPALGSPETDLFDDDGLFSFESPTIPVISSSQSALETQEDEEEENLPEANDPPEREYQEENDNANNENSHEEVCQPPTSPQPGCSHWPTTPTIRPLTPPPPTLSDLMPPPIARPPRTPRKLFDPNIEDHPPRLSIGSPEPLDVSHDVDEADSECDAMPVGTEAANVSDSVGGIYNVLKQPGIFRAGMRLMQKVAAKEMSTQEMESTLKSGSKKEEESKALVPVSPAQRKRDLSPDICDIVPDKRLRLAVAARRSRKDSFDESRNNQTRNEDQNNAVVLRHVNSDDESSDMENASNNEQLMEYFSTIRSGGSAYEPHGDEFDLSQRSYCMLNVVPQYELKSRLYKIHSKAVRESSVREILDHYKKIQSDLFGIFKGTIPSSRHNIFVKGFEAKRDLRNLNVTVPFTSEQVSALVTMIYDKLVPDKSMRCDYMDYVNYVLVPEAFIRIYSRINSIPYPMAEVEMRFRACYEGEVSPQHLTLPRPPELSSLD